MTDVLALDLSTKVGWARTTAGVSSGVLELPVRKGFARGIRFQDFRTWLAEEAMDVNPDAVVYERPHLRGWHATKLLVGLMSVVETACAIRGIDVYTCHTGTLKKWATCSCHTGPQERCGLDSRGKVAHCKTGSGKASKADMIEAARKLWAYTVTPQDDNEADALCLLRLSVAPGNLELLELVS